MGAHAVNVCRSPHVESAPCPPSTVRRVERWWARRAKRAPSPTLQVLLLCTTPLHAEPADAIAPITPAQCAHMRQHHVMNPPAPVPCERLRLVSFTHINFDGAPRTGALVVM